MKGKFETSFIFKWENNDSNKFLKGMLRYEPPNCNSAVDCICSHSFEAKHWYIPWSSFCIFFTIILGGSVNICLVGGIIWIRKKIHYLNTNGHILTSILLSLINGLLLCIHEISWIGEPDTMHWNCASLSTSIVCTCGCRWAVSGAAKKKF